MSQAILFYTSGRHRNIVYIDYLMEFDSELFGLPSDAATRLSTKLNKIPDGQPQFESITELLEGFGKAADETAKDPDLDELNDEIQDLLSTLADLEKKGEKSAALLVEADYVKTRYMQNFRTEIDLLQSPEMLQACDFSKVLNDSSQEFDEMQFHSPSEWIEPLTQLIFLAGAIPDEKFIAGKFGLVGDLEEFLESLNEAHEKELLFCLCLE